MAFGKVYKINFKTREKNVYPVVYINRDYIVCKQNGATKPLTFFRDEINFSGEIHAIDLDVFRKKWDGHMNQACIYVPHGIKEDFSDFYTRSKLEIELGKAEDGYNKLNDLKNMYKSRIESYTTHIKKCEEKIKDCDEAMDKQAERIAKLRVQIEEEKKQKMKEKENTNE